jgi:hypothetical protein
MGFGGPEMMSAALMIADKAAEDGDDELAATTMDLLEMMMRNFPRLVHVVLSDILKLYAELGRGSASNATTTLRTRLLKLAEMSGAEVAKANWSKGNKAKAVDETSASEFTADMERVLFKDGNVQEAKHAVRLLSRMVQKTSSSPDSVSSSPSSGGKSKNPTSMETVERVAATIASPKQLKVENKRLLVFLHGLREVAKNFSEVFQNHALKVRKFVLSKVVLKISAQEGKGKSSKKQGFSEDCLRLCAALKLLSYDLSPGDKISDIIDEKDIDEEEDDTFVKGTVVDLLFNILDEEVPGDRSLSSSEMVQVRRVAACALLRIGAHFDFTPAQWHTLGWTMQDSEDRVRLKFMRTVAEAVKEVRVPLRFIAYMVLASGESEGVEKKNATESLLSAIKRLRQEHIKRMSALSEDSILDEGVSVMEASMMMDDGLDEERRILNTSLMPEYVLPYVVHLLAHHPDFPSSKTDVGRIKVCERNLKALLDPLIASLGHEADNISFLLQMFSKMVEHQDCLDGDTFRIHLIASIGKKALKKMIKSPESIKPYPGTIYLPTNLFVPRIADEEDKDEDMGGLNSGDESGKRAKSFPSPSDTWGSPIAPASDSTSRSNTKSRKRTSASSSKSKKSRLQDLLSSDDEEKDDDEEEVDEDEMEELVDMRIGGLGSPDNGRRNQPRGAKKGVEYLVKWSGKPASASTWEPVANISDKSLIVDFEKRSKAIEDAMAEQEELKSPKRARSSGGSRSKHVNQEEDDEAEEEDEESPNKSTNSSRSTKRGRRAKSPPPTAPSDEEQVEQEEPPAKATNKNTKLPKKSPKKKATKQTKPTPSKSPKGSKRAVEAAESSDSEEEVETLSRRRKGRR